MYWYYSAELYRPLFRYTRAHNIFLFHPAIIHQLQVPQLISCVSTWPHPASIYFPWDVYCLVLWLNDPTRHFVTPDSNCFPIEVRAYITLRALLASINVSDEVGDDAIGVLDSAAPSSCRMQRGIAILWNDKLNLS